MSVRGKVTIKDYFIKKGLQKMLVDLFLQKHFKSAGYVKVDLVRTPMGTRVIIYAERPGRIVGRRHIYLRALREILEKEFGIERPSIYVHPVEKPELNAKVMAERIARALERGVRFRRAAFTALRMIMAAGARGAEIIISGKLRSERAKFEKFTAGVVFKSGTPSEELVDEAVTYALLKPGVYGITVRITLPNKRHPDDIEIKEEAPPEAEKLVKEKKAEGE